VNKMYFRKIVVFILIASFFSVAVFAATQDVTFTSSSDGRQFYTPHTCSIVVTDTCVYFSHLQWENRSFGAAYYWEGELRAGTTSVEVADAYGSCTAVVGTLPYLYKEYDPDDISVGCADMAGLDSSETYYAQLTTTTGPDFSSSSGVELKFESEYGMHLGVDGLPLRYQEFSTHINTQTRPAISWRQ